MATCAASMPAYRGRFAPSPTGRIHLGTARTALVAWLRARRAGGTFVVRNEDLDGPRTVPGAIEAILDDLRWLGLDWDEGPDVPGPHAPYTQSARSERYVEALRALERGGVLFRCTCSRKELASAASAPHGDEPIYPGTCRLRPSHPERPASLRFRLEVVPSFDDAFLGPRAPAGGDFVVRRADGVFSYQLAVAVDDRDMKITEVVRGDDLVGSTPKQIAILRALGSTPPRYLHVPLVLDGAGERLGKRHGSLAIGELRARGVRAERVVGWLAGTLGFPSAMEVEARELVRGFVLATIPKEPVRAPEDGAAAW